MTDDPKLEAVRQHLLLWQMREHVMRAHILRQVRRDRRLDIIRAIVLGALLGVAIGIPFVL